MAPNDSAIGADVDDGGDSDSDNDDENDDESKGRLKTIVKMGLLEAMQLSRDEYKRFANEIETYVRATSKMLHRASLALSLRLLQLAQAGLPLPDLHNQKDTYWKNWLRLAPELVPADDPAWSSFKEYVGPIDSSVVHDQVLAYAAITFKTVVINNTWVPLIPRITRLTKAVVKANTRDAAAIGLSAWKVMSEIRSKMPAMEGWPTWASKYVNEVRTRLKMDGTVYLFDDYAKKSSKNMSFQDVYMLNFWIQQQLISLEEKRIALSPIFRVRRAFVRLDKKVLIEIAKRAIPGDKSVKALNDIEKQKEYEFRNPDKGDASMLQRLPLREKRESLGDYKARCQPTMDENARMKATDEYKKRKASFVLWSTVKRQVASSLFGKVAMKKAKAGYRFDGSIVTDGVAVCLQYSKPAKQAPVVKTATATRAKTKTKTTAGADAMDPHLSTYVQDSNTLVIGLDPGRSNIAAVAYILSKEDSSNHPGALASDAWNLGRSRYYTESGIREQDMIKNERFAPVMSFWQKYTHAGNDDDESMVIGSMRTSEFQEAMEYVRRFSLVRDDWWGLAMRRRESRADMKRYSGKRRVLDSFFSSIRSTLQKMFRGVNLQIAYGQAYQSMKATGKGEVAVPVSSTFKACVRTFGSRNVKATDEYGTTKYEWGTGYEKLAVYREVTRVAGNMAFSARTRNTTSKVMPLIGNSDDAEAAKWYALKRTNKIKVGRSGLFSVRSKDDAREQTRYPEVRGLRFSTKTRSYLDRDLHAARTIGRLRTLELTGRPRPAPFCRSIMAG